MWAGHGDLVELGLGDPLMTYSADERNADIYIGRSDGAEDWDIEPGANVWCAVYEGGGVFGRLPVGWRPP